tara:strand:+ start:125 stop:307 length:183 start_codon:yes stop_codon:yes gene_type:complete
MFKKRATGLFQKKFAYTILIFTWLIRFSSKTGSKINPKIYIKEKVKYLKKYSRKIYNKNL